AFIDNLRRDPRHRDVDQLLLAEADLSGAAAVGSRHLQGRETADGVVSEFQGRRTLPGAYSLLRALWARHGVDQSPHQDDAFDSHPLPGICYHTDPDRLRL